MADQRGLILWTLCGTGVFLLYAAYKNQSPQTLLLNHLNGTNTVAPISGGSTVPAKTDASGSSGGGNVPGWVGPFSLPPIPDHLPAWIGPFSLGNTTSRQNNNGTYTVLDPNGNALAVVPAGYQNSPETYRAVNA